MLNVFKMFSFIFQLGLILLDSNSFIFFWLVLQPQFDCCAYNIMVTSDVCRPVNPSVFHQILNLSLISTWSIRFVGLSDYYMGGLRRQLWRPEMLLIAPPRLAKMFALCRYQHLWSFMGVCVCVCVWQCWRVLLLMSTYCNNTRLVSNSET